MPQVKLAVPFVNGTTSIVTVLSAMHPRGTGMACVPFNDAWPIRAPHGVEPCDTLPRGHRSDADLPALIRTDS